MKTCDITTIQKWLVHIQGKMLINFSNILLIRRISMRQACYLIQCISDNDDDFNKREGLYTERIRRICIEHQILRVTYLRLYFLVLSSSWPTSSRSEKHEKWKLFMLWGARYFSSNLKRLFQLLWIFKFTYLTIISYLFWMIWATPLS